MPRSIDVSTRLTRAWEARFPVAVLLVDRAAILDLFLASGVTTSAHLAVVCIDETPTRIVAWLRQAFRAGRRAPVLYVHDAATVIYPFSVEPIATLVEHAERAGAEPIVYDDLGLPPHGASARRFDDATLPRDEPIMRLEAIPPATLVRYCMEAAYRLAGQPLPGAAKPDGGRRRAR